jgi:hypothetical protein
MLPHTSDAIPHPIQISFFVFGIALLLAGCSQTTAPNPKPTKGSRTKQMDNASLFLNGMDWVYTCPGDNERDFRRPLGFGIAQG